MFQAILNFVKDSRFQSALVGAFLGGLSTFIFAYWGISVDFGAVVPSQEPVETITTEEVSTEPAVFEPATESLVDIPSETLEVVAE